MSEMPEALRAAVAAHQTKRRPMLPVEGPADIRAGDLVLVNPDVGSAEARSIWHVGKVHTEPFPYFVGNLAHNATEMATEADWITHVLPYRLVIQGELYGTIDISQVVGVLGHAGPHRSHLWDLDGHDECGRRFLPLQGPADPRWQFKHDELERLNEFVLETRGRLLDGIWRDE